MSKDNYDVETSKAVSETQALDAMFSSSGWAIAQKELDEIIKELRDARNLPQDEMIADHLRVNLAVAENLEAWVDDLKGRVENAIIMADKAPQANLVERR